MQKQITNANTKKQIKKSNSDVNKNKKTNTKQNKTATHYPPKKRRPCTHDTNKQMQNKMQKQNKMQEQSASAKKK